MFGVSADSYFALLCLGWEGMASRTWKSDRLGLKQGDPMNTVI